MSEILQRYKEIASAAPGQASSMPFEVYHSNQVYQHEANTLFRNEWVFVCCEQELSNPGDYYALTLAGEAIAILRGQDGKLRALSNICRHRGTPLLDEGFGTTGKLIVCPYHAWSYDNQGELKGVPFAAPEEVNKSEHCLPVFHHDSIMGLVFINLSTNPQPLRERFEGLEQYAAVFEPEKFDHALPGTSETWQANWKLAMENAMESYHLFKVHKETLETVTPSKQAYYIAGSSEWTLTGGKMINHSSKLTKWLQGEQPEVYSHYLLLSLPPSFVGIMSYDSLGWLTALPVDGENTIIRAGAITESSAGAEGRDSQQFTEAFFTEDKWICERVQRGMKSRIGHGGSLVDMERVVVDFHQFLASRLFDTGSTPHYDNPQPTPFHVDSIEKS